MMMMMMMMMCCRVGDMLSCLAHLGLVMACVVAARQGWQGMHFALCPKPTLESSFCSVTDLDSL